MAWGDGKKISPVGIGLAVNANAILSEMNYPRGDDLLQGFDASNIVRPAALADPLKNAPRNISEKIAYSFWL